ncbi:MAG TPA: hypothetical protein DCZ40_08855 [Lachnospiraceae bacterium]|nr:hypothetical protein [Lachnospiraceae bacterium]
MKNRKLMTKLTAAGSMALMLMPMTAFAGVSETQDVTQEETDAGATKDTDVLYTQSSTYSVIIPKLIVLDGQTKDSGYTVNVKGDISSDKQVSVAPQDAIADKAGINFYMKDQATVGTKKADVQADVTQDATVWSSAEVCVANTGTTKNGKVEAPTITAGSWKGTFAFNIALQDAD